MALDDTQYCPISTDETAKESSGSVRMIRDMALGANNQKSMITNPWINWINEDSQPLEAPDGTDANEQFVKEFAPRRITDGHEKLQFHITHFFSTGTPGTITWRIYASPVMVDEYGAAGDTRYWTDYTGYCTSISFTTTSATQAIQCSEMSAPVFDGYRGPVFLFLTAQASAASLKATIRGFACQPKGGA